VRSGGERSWTINTGRSGLRRRGGSGRRWWALLPIGLVAIAAAIALAIGGSTEDDGTRSASAASEASATGQSSTARKAAADEPPKGGEPQGSSDPQKSIEPSDDQRRSEDQQPREGSRQRKQSDPRQRDSGFRIATVRRGARVGIYSRPGGRVIERLGLRTEFGSPQVFSVIRRRGSWLRVATALSANNRHRWIRADLAALRFGTTNVSIHASLSDRVVQLRRNGRVAQRLPVTIGAPGTPTPRGRFAVTDVIFKGLNPVYGCCAIALSARQPNLQDNWTGGDRIAIHGSTGAIGTASSNGCLRATDPDVSKLADRIPLGAPVFIEN
jgi:hypothetical protein